MRGSKKIIAMTSEQMRAAPSKTDWARIRRELAKDPEAAAMNRKIGKLIAEIEKRKRGRPNVGEPKTAISLRVPVSVIQRWKETGPGWQTRMVQALEKRAPKAA